MTLSINNISINSQTKQQQSFQGGAGLRFLDGFLKSQENLSATRFIQGTATNWFPKAVLSRSKVDLTEFTFLEFLESGLFYFAAPLLGEHLYRKNIFNKIQPSKIKKEIYNNIPKSLEQIKKSNLDKNLKNRLITTKAGMVLGCLAVPALEYALSFGKNLFTLKVFKVGNFNNVANLDKAKTEDKAQQDRIEKHSKYELKKAGLLSVSGTLVGLSLAAFGHKSKNIVKLSEIILEPGQHLAELLKVKSKKANNFLKDYLKLDFNNSEGKLSLSKGQLAATCITGLFGYSAAAKDRGKLDLYEVWTRVPLVVIYTIFGSALFDSGFKNILAKKGKFSELIKKDKEGDILPVPSRKELPQIAKKLAEKSGTKVEKELETLIRQKSIITGVPYLFSLLVMGFTLSAVARIWTRIRYNNQVKNQSNYAQWNFQASPVFQGFKTNKK